jgi:hypothetical protein
MFLGGSSSCVMLSGVMGWLLMRSLFFLVFMFLGGSSSCVMLSGVMGWLFMMGFLFCGCIMFLS